MRKKSVSYESDFSLFLCAGYCQRSLTLFAQRAIISKKNIDIISNKEAAGHE